MVGPERSSLPAPAPLLSIRNLCKRFGDRVVLKDVSFEIGAGEAVVPATIFAVAFAPVFAAAQAHGRLDDVGRARRAAGVGQVPGQRIEPLAELRFVEQAAQLAFQGGGAGQPRRRAQADARMQDARGGARLGSRWSRC